MLHTLWMIPFCSSSSERRNLVCFFRLVRMRTRRIFSQGLPFFLFGLYLGAPPGCGTSGRLGVFLGQLFHKKVRDRARRPGEGLSDVYQLRQGEGHFTQIQTR